MRFGYVVAAIIAVLLGAVAWYALANPVQHGSDAAHGVEVRVDFGLRQQPVTRSFDLDVCSQQPASPECPPQEGEEGEGTDPVTTFAERPQIISAAVIRDLGEVREASSFANDTCTYKRRGSQFPAAQFKTVAENRGQRGVVVTLTANSQEPEAVEPGTYCGAVVVQRSDGRYLRYDLTASVADRTVGGLRVRAFGALLAGGLAGAAVRWLGDSYAAIAPLRRRQRRILRRLRPFISNLPEPAQHKLDTIDLGISQYDADGLDAALKEIEGPGDELARFGFALSETDTMIAEQLRHRDLAYLPALDLVVGAERARRAALMSEEFPWPEPKRVASEAESLRQQASAIRDALVAANQDAYRAAVRSLVGADAFADFMERTDTGSTAEQLLPDAERQRPQAKKEKRSFNQRLLDNSMLLVMVVAALVVAFVGYQTEFVHDPSFDSGSGDYIRLFAWAFALQVAGVTVFEVAGKLLTSRKGSVPATP